MSRDRDYPLTPVEAVMRRRRYLRWLLILAAAVAIVVYLVFANQYVIAHENELEHFKYGSIGSEPESGLPVPVFKALPAMYRDVMGEAGWRHFGFLYEDGADLPIGMSTRIVKGFKLAWLNCAVCHVGTVEVDGKRAFLWGAPANNLRLHDLIAFLLDVGRDPGFNADALIAAIESEEVDADLNALERLLYRFVVFPRVKQELLDLNDRLSFVYRQHDWGPGRVDTFNPYKAIQFNFPMDPGHISDAALNGASDFPSIWQQRPREGMNLHWDGNNPSVDERNLSAALGAGVTPRTVDVAAISRVKDWMWELPAPPFPDADAIDFAKARRGEALFTRYCAGCHGMRPLGEEAGHSRPAYDYDKHRYPALGEVVALEEIGTDPGRWASYTVNFAAAQNMLYAGYPWRFRHFRKTGGYANHPLDGIWARSPYLHNGSVPTLADLLEPADKRPVVWHRGGDAYDVVRVGYVSTSDGDADGAPPPFQYDTRVPGNANTGHDGPRYGTHLPAAEKAALLEYMKTL